MNTASALTGRTSTGPPAPKAWRSWERSHAGCSVVAHYVVDGPLGLGRLLTQLAGPAIAADLRDRPVEADELNRARLPAVERLRRNQADNGYWLGQLSQAQSDPQALDQIRSNVQDLESVTPADIQRLAQAYLKPETAWRAEIVSSQPATAAAPAAPAAR